MPYGIDNETEEWLKGLEKKLYAKLKAQCLRLGSIMPYVPEHGCYYDNGGQRTDCLDERLLCRYAVADVSRI